MSTDVLDSLPIMLCHFWVPNKFEQWVQKITSLEIVHKLTMLTSFWLFWTTYPPPPPPPPPPTVNIFYLINVEMWIEMPIFWKHRVCLFSLPRFFDELFWHNKWRSVFDVEKTPAIITNKSVNFQFIHFGSLSNIKYCTGSLYCNFPGRSNHNHLNWI